LERLQRARVSEFSRWFFADAKFQRPAQFIDTLGAMARLRVPEIPSVIDRDRQASETRTGVENLGGDTESRLSRSSRSHPAVTPSWRSDGALKPAASFDLWSAADDMNSQQQRDLHEASMGSGPS